MKEEMLIRKRNTAESTVMLGCCCRRNDLPPSISLHPMLPPSFSLQIGNTDVSITASQAGREWLMWALKSSASAAAAVQQLESKHIGNFDEETDDDIEMLLSAFLKIRRKRKANRHLSEYVSLEFDARHIAELEDAIVSSGYYSGAVGQALLEQRQQQEEVLAVEIKKLSIDMQLEILDYVEVKLQPESSGPNLRSLFGRIDGYQQPLLLFRILSIDQDILNYVRLSDPYGILLQQQLQHLSFGTKEGGSSSKGIVPCLRGSRRLLSNLRSLEVLSISQTTSEYSIDSAFLVSKARHVRVAYGNTSAKVPLFSAAGWPSSLPNLRALTLDYLDPNVVQELSRLQCPRFRTLQLQFPKTNLPSVENFLKLMQQHSRCCVVQQLRELHIFSNQYDKVDPMPLFKAMQQMPEEVCEQLALLRVEMTMHYYLSEEAIQKLLSSLSRFKNLRCLELISPKVDSLKEIVQLQKLELLTLPDYAAFEPQEVVLLLDLPMLRSLTLPGYYNQQNARDNAMIETVKQLLQMGRLEELDIAELSSLFDVVISTPNQLRKLVLRLMVHQNQKVLSKKVVRFLVRKPEGLLVHRHPASPAIDLLDATRPTSTLHKEKQVNSALNSLVFDF